MIGEVRYVEEIIEDIKIEKSFYYDTEKLTEEQAMYKAKVGKVELVYGFEVNQYQRDILKELFKQSVQNAVNIEVNKVLDEIRGYYPIDLEHCNKGEAFILKLVEELKEKHPIEMKDEGVITEND